MSFNLDKTMIDYKTIAVISEVETGTKNPSIARVARSLKKLLMEEQIQQLATTCRLPFNKD